MCHRWLAWSLAALFALFVIRELWHLSNKPGIRTTTSASGLLGLRSREWFRCRMQPFVELAVAIGLTADVVTGLQLVTSLLCAIAYASGRLFAAGLLLILSGTLDVLDGEIARHRNHDGPRGAFLDSVTDRYGEAFVFGGLLAFYRSSWSFWLVASAWAGSFLVSYARARAESLGVSCSEGWLQRPERYVILGGTSMVGPLVSHATCNLDSEPILLTVGIGTVAVLANATAVQRIRATLRRLA